MLVHNTSRYLHLHYAELIERLIVHGWIVKCAAPKDESVPSLEALGAVCIDVSLSRRGMNPFREVGGLVTLYQVFRRERPDAVMNFSIKPAIYGSLAARAARVPRICSMITGLGYVFLAQGALPAILSWVVGWGYRAALAGNYRVFFQNPDDSDFFLKRGIVRERQCVVLNGTGIDTQRFSPRPASKKPRGIGFLMVARLLGDKGVREYEEAAARLRRENSAVRCGLLGPWDDNPAAIGSDELACWLERGFVEYLGETDDVAAVIAEYDVFVLPSYREGLPRATLEAMAMGKPVISTDVPGCRETVVEGVNGYLVPVRDAVALKAAMSRFVADPSLIDSLGAASRDIAVRKYDVHKVNEEIVQIITGATAHA